jgi:peptide deformylase
MKYAFMLLTLFPFLTLAQQFDKHESALIGSGDIQDRMRVIQIDVEDELKILKSESKDINPKAKDLDILINRMYLAVTHPTDGGVGIAAPQVGINRNVIWVQRFDKLGEPFEVYINPKIVWKSKLMRKGAEGCLSIPEQRGDVFRHYTIEIEYQDRQGKKHSEKVEGFTAVIFQHEIDHLNGILFTDRLLEQEAQEFHLINQDVNLYLIDKLYRQ